MGAGRQQALPVAAGEPHKGTRGQLLQKLHNSAFSLVKQKGGRRAADFTGFP
jgi:hypothetical protein